MLVTCQRFGDLFLFGLVWHYSSVQFLGPYIIWTENVNPFFYKVLLVTTISKLESLAQMIGTSKEIGVKVIHFN